MERGGEPQKLGDVLKAAIGATAPIHPQSTKPQPKTIAYKCPRCKDIHYLFFRSGEYSSKYLPCPDCLPPAQFTLANFSRRAGAEKALKATRNWVGGKGKPWLVLMGAHGVGKTHLAQAAHRWLVEHLQECVYTYAISLFDELRKSYAFSRDDPEYASQVEREYIKPDWLIVDDLGAEKENAWVRERTEKIFNVRYENKRRTLITSNLILDDFIPALASRIHDHRICDWVTITASDYRKEGVK